MAKEKQLKITLVKSPITYAKNQRDTLVVVLNLISRTR